MKILILVLSYNIPPYSQLMRAQQETWDSIEVPGVRTVYYYGGMDVVTGVQTKGRSFLEFGFPITDAYYLMAGKFKLMLQEALKWDDWDFIFRTNSSSYVNKIKLVEVAKRLPQEKLYAGWTLEDSNDDGGLMVSGAGIWLSRDCAKILCDDIDPLEELEEDVLIGRVLRKHGIVAIDDKSRADWGKETWYLMPECYHIRFKTNNRLQDVRNMYSVHKHITGQ